jgi:hypothetical protein
MGPLIDNVRLGTLTHHFPKFFRRKEHNSEEEWKKKIALDLSSYKADFEEITNPKAVVILFPWIEVGRKGFFMQSIEDERDVFKALFENMSQKISETVLLYDVLPIMALDEPEMAFARLDSIKELIRHKTVKNVASVLSNPFDCWGDLLK